MIVVVLPQPDSPTSAERLALADVEAHAVDGAHRADAAPQQRAFRQRDSSSRGRGPRASSRRLRARLGRDRARPVRAARGKTSRARQSARFDLAAAMARGADDPRRTAAARRASGSTSRTFVDAHRAARRERAARRQRDERRRVAFDRRQRCAVRRRRAAAPTRAGPACTASSADRRRRRRAPISTSLPAYITATRPRRPRSTPRSCVISRSATRRSLAAPSCSTSRICAWIVTSSAVVGSSAMITSRIVRDRHRDHHALAHAARELVRERGRRAARDSGCRRASSSSIARRARRLAPTVLMHEDRLGELIADGVDRRQRGERILEHHRDLAAADRGQLAVRAADELSPFEPHRALIVARAPAATP